MAAPQVLEGLLLPILRTPHIAEDAIGFLGLHSIKTSKQLSNCKGGLLCLLWECQGITQTT